MAPKRGVEKKSIETKGFLSWMRRIHKIPHPCCWLCVPSQRLDDMNFFFERIMSKEWCNVIITKASIFHQNPRNDKFWGRITSNAGWASTRNCLPDLFLFSWSVFSHAFFARPAAPAAVSRESKKNKLHMCERGGRALPPIFGNIVPIFWVWVGTEAWLYYCVLFSIPRVFEQIHSTPFFRSSHSVSLVFIAIEGGEGQQKPRFAAKTGNPLIFLKKEGTKKLLD